MSATSDSAKRRVRIGSPAALLAAVPVLLGFQPGSSIVVVGTEPVLCQNSLIGADLAFRARYAALRYSLISPPRTCLRSIRAVTSMAFPGWRCGGSCCRLWCGRWPL